MLPPHELKTKKFSRVMRGYSPDEVDDQVEFLIEQYSALYRENDELERKLHLALSSLDAYKKDEESIRSALVNAQKAGNKILSEASERAEILMESAKQTCDEMVSQTALAIKEQMALLAMLRAQAAAFRTHLLSVYKEQLDAVEQNAVSEHELDLPAYADEDVVRRIVAGIKEKAAEKTKEGAKEKKKPRTGTIWDRDTMPYLPRQEEKESAALMAVIDEVMADVPEEDVGDADEASLAAASRLSADAPEASGDAPIAEAPLQEHQESKPAEEPAVKE